MEGLTCHLVVRHERSFLDFGLSGDDLVNSRSLHEDQSPPGKHHRRLDNPFNKFVRGCEPNDHNRGLYLQLASTTQHQKRPHRWLSSGQSTPKAATHQ